LHLADVWHSQAKLLRRMLDSGLEAILVKIAAIGAQWNHAV
jgi:diphthamide synthase (EF-2-diphthine--ammonia ligase)